jgi:DNA polymerase-3 subunit beta
MPGSTGTVPGALLAAAVAQVAIAAGRDDTLPTLTGIRVEIADTTITLAATDRYRLAVREFAWTPEVTGLDTHALVPARTLADTAKSLAHCDLVHLALSASGAGDGLMGFEDAPPRACSTASSRSTAPCCPASPPRSPRWKLRRWSMPSSASPSWPSATPRCD